MTSTLVRIDPDLPLCWEDPHTLRVGFDHARARIHNPSPAAQQFLATLRTGIHSSRITETAASCGLSPADTTALLHTLRGVVRADREESHGRASPADARLQVRLCDDGRPVPALRAALFASELCTLNLAPEERQPSDLVVLVQRFFEPLGHAQHWLARGVPHLPIRFSDEEVVVGPLVASGGAPCTSCIARHAVARDAALPALAAQLIGHEAASESPASAEVAASASLVLIRHWRHGNASVHRTRIRFFARRGVIRSAPRLERVLPHPDCACRMLEHFEAAR